ncbi:hypothetical protein GW17_00046953 [Ensete ventricosum]|nr:hypothetical protein GW17_00046953 [Ensete ventricosum]
MSVMVPDVAIDPYEAAVITLPAVVKERLLQLLRVGIATRYDVSRYRLSPALFPPPSSSLYGRPLLSRSSARKLEDITPSYRVPVSSMQYGPGTGSSLRLTPKEHPVERRQMKFDPFTGEPYKYDPFTGEPIKPELHGP